jgi:hypothetical protein
MILFALGSLSNSVRYTVVILHKQKQTDSYAYKETKQFNGWFSLVPQYIDLYHYEYLRAIKQLLKQHKTRIYNSRNHLNARDITIVNVHVILNNRRMLLASTNERTINQSMIKWWWEWWHWATCIVRSISFIYRLAFVHIMT